MAQRAGCQNSAGRTLADDQPQHDALQCPPSWPAGAPGRDHRRHGRLETNHQRRAAGPGSGSYGSQTPIRTSSTTALPALGTPAMRQVQKPPLLAGSQDDSALRLPVRTRSRRLWASHRRRFPLEELVADAVLLRLDTPDLAAALSGAVRSDADSAAVMDTISADREQLEELAKLYANKGISIREWIAARKIIEDRITTTERRIRRTTNTSQLATVIGPGSFPTH